MDRVNPSIRKYCTTRDELFQPEGILFKGRKIIIPLVLRPEMLELIHESHLGLERCKERARMVMYWPGMAGDIERTVTQCSTCLSLRRKNLKKPSQPHPIPQRPREKLRADIITYKAKDYLLVADYYSKNIDIPVRQPASVFTWARSTYIYFTSGRYSSQMGAAAYGYLVVGKAFNRDSSRMKRY